MEGGLCRRCVVPAAGGHRPWLPDPLDHRNPLPGLRAVPGLSGFFSAGFQEAFACHPLFWAVPVMFGAIFWWERKGSRWARNLALVLGAAFLLIYGGRLILGDPRMEIAVGESLMARPFMILKRVL